MNRSIIGILFLSACWAQQPEFEVATIKASPPPQMGRMMMGTRGGPGTEDPGRFSCTNCTLMMLLTSAYNVQRFQVTGPPVLDSEHFEIVAKVPAGATREQFRLMLQKLLADRFQVKLHHDSKDMPIYELVVAKGGPKLKESTAPAGDTQQQSGEAGPLRTDKDGLPVIPPGRGGLMAMTPRGARMAGSQETMQQLASRLSGIVGRTVTDGTGLTGKYDYILSFAPEMGRMMMMGPPPGPPGGDVAGPGPGPGQMRDGASPVDSAPTIFTALQEQLGLKLEQKKGPVDLLVIDHVEKTPTEN